ncbi:MAG TPA: DUF1572 family protein [Longimicrobiales bacterium]|nr:DUF1572 family protein [Longimicrobiales bacterium]
MNDELGRLMLSDLAREYKNQRDLAERALAQLSDEEIFRPLGDEDNTIAILMKHVGGNLRSRWTDFLTSNGEKPDRNRDGEFEAGDTSDVVYNIWNTGFATLETALGNLRPEDLTASVTIRADTVSVVQAMNRNLAHTAQHVGQIIMMAKHWRGREWKTLSIPKKQNR